METNPLTVVGRARCPQRAAGATVLWKYRAIYLDGDQVFGQWSDVGSIAVTG